MGQGQQIDASLLQGQLQIIQTQLRRGKIAIFDLLNQGRDKLRQYTDIMQSPATMQGDLTSEATLATMHVELQEGFQPMPAELTTARSGQSSLAASTAAMTW